MRNKNFVYTYLRSKLAILYLATLRLWQEGTTQEYTKSKVMSNQAVYSLVKHREIWDVSVTVATLFGLSLASRGVFSANLRTWLRGIFMLQEIAKLLRDMYHK